MLEERIDQDMDVMKRKKVAYINYATLLFCIIYGIKALDGQCVTYFSEIMIDRLGFTTAQYSSLSSLYYLSTGISSITFGVITGQSAKRKRWLIPMTLFSGIASIATACVHSYIQFAICRFLSGICQGGLLTMMMGILAQNLYKEDYGLRNGFVGCGSAVIGSAIGPILIAVLAERFAWNAAFIVTGIMMLICSFLTGVSIGEVECEIQPASNEKEKWTELIKELCKHRNFVLCLAIGLLETAGNICIGVFAPLYYSDVLGFDSISKGWFLSLKGFTFIPASLLVPLLADKLPIKRVMIVAFALSSLAPASAFLASGTVVSAWVLAIFGAWAGATISLFVYIIPRMSLPEHLHGVASGVINGCADLFGGCIAPLFLSVLIDVGIRIQIILGICAVILVSCILLTAFISMNKANTQKMMVK